MQTFRCPPRVDDVDRCGAGGGGDDPHGLHQDSQGVSHMSNSIPYFFWTLFLSRLSTNRESCNPGFVMNFDSKSFDIKNLNYLGKFPSTSFCSHSSPYLRACLLEWWEKLQPPEWYHYLCSLLSDQHVLWRGRSHHCCWDHHWHRACPHSLRFPGLLECVCVCRVQITKKTFHY